MKSLTLNNGNTYLMVGSGTNTFGKENNQYMGEINNDTTPIESAIANGYRRFDTAISYRNESVVSLGIARSGIARSDVFITSKLPTDHDYIKDEQAIAASVQSSLKALDSDYIDLYLIHHPLESLEENLRIYRVLESFYKEGVLKNIGVSNFTQEQLAYLIEHAEVKPVVNQIECNFKNFDKDLVDYCQAQDVVVEAWGPFHGITEHQKATLSTIGKAYNKSWSQVFLRYLVEHNIAVIPKSHNASRQLENLELFDFELTDQDVLQIETLMIV